MNSWPFVADHWHRRWQQDGGCELIRTAAPDAQVSQLVPNPTSVQRLVLLGFPVTAEDFEPYTALEECYLMPEGNAEAGVAALEARGVSIIPHRADVYWGQSVAEFGLALTICALRRIPQNYAAMQSSHAPWDYSPTTDPTGVRGGQFGDDIRFCNGTIAGKQVRVVGAGNIGSRYAS